MDGCSTRPVLWCWLLWSAQFDLACLCWPHAGVWWSRYSNFNDSTHGWLDSDYIVPLFTAYADTCFNAFSDRVKHWTTFNEPHSFCVSVGVGVWLCGVGALMRS